MKIDPASIKDTSVLEVLPRHAEWLKASLPEHHRVLTQMLRDGRARIITDVEAGST